MHGVFTSAPAGWTLLSRPFVIIRVLVCKPGLKLLVFAVEKSQDFADDVGRVGIKELRILVEIESDIFFQANLEGRSF